MDRPRVTAIIPAGGRGSRMGSRRPKQYLLLNGKPILWHTLRRFETSSWVDRIVLVVRAEDLDYCRHQVLEGAGFGKVGPLVPGGRERWESVLAGLQQTTPEEEIVLVHDAVRPFVTDELLERVVGAVRERGAAIAGLPAKETIKVVRDHRIQRTPERATLWSAQTPQGFRRELLWEGFAQLEDSAGVTDDAALVEKLGHPVWMVEGDYRNLKITTPEDLAWAELTLAREGKSEMRETQMRVGQGYDVHRLATGRKLVLGGVEIPFEQGLAGHSDADVLTHAIIDALLGAAGCGDIGRLFPDTEARYKDISSLILLEEVRKLLVEKEVKIVNIDAVIQAQRPKLAPHMETMERTLASVLQIASAAISLKATTTERLGFVGREEGIAAQAVALVVG